MCRLCSPTTPRALCPGKAPLFSAATETSSGAAAAQAARTNITAAPLPKLSGEPGTRLLIKGGVVMSVDDAVGNFAKGDVLIEGSKIVEVAAHIEASDAHVIDAAGKIVMPGFIDTHHHQFETGLRSSLSDAIVVNDGKPENARNYYEAMLLGFSQHYRPEDVYINELYGGLAQLDAGVTTVMDVSQIHHSAQHSDAAIEGLRDAGRRGVFGYFEGWWDGKEHPGGARRIREQYFSSDDQLLSMVMGGEIYIEGYEDMWQIGRDLDLQIALHVVTTFGMTPTFDELAKKGVFGPDNIFIHMTGMTDDAWKAAADAGAHVSLSVPIEMHMRHGQPPIQKALGLGMTVSLSSDVECTMSADFFTQMRGMITLQRMHANELALSGQDHPGLMRCADAIRHATIEGAKGLRLDGKTGSLTPGKEADIILLDAEAINVAPLNNAPGAVVTLMDRTNVDTVMVAGKIRKWQGQLLGHDIDKLRSELEQSRDYIFEKAGVQHDLFA
ncbi:amidohydrolase family protein [Aestuariicoccus sp. MJ-SS9]|uniref:amidohydrolase family protein n=1 Tax=Aestuariicoccus sp. MJ-SS9 TaxID=3079855 RepID=UPI002907AE09|nr:amidohydrolase family protein [Aestuariicoccus sp. MJ-SS9]MDU8912314.1 amidohydrolase family protein [Aestuariicoccus sp. MJ-SS9]